MGRMTKNARHGALAGLAVGLTDLVVLEVMGVAFMWKGYNLILPVMGVFAATFAALGYMNGKLVDARQALLRSQAEKLQYEKLASIGQMAATVAHEVRNPLGVIKSASSLLTESLPADDADGHKAGRFISEEIDRLDAFVRALLDYARPIQAQRERIGLDELAERVERLTAGQPLRPQIDVESGHVHVDPELMAHAIAALVTNACQAAKTRVSVTIRVLHGGLDVRVIDDGDGVDDELATTIFEPFVTHKTKGTGLGLPMAARVVQAHSGELSLDPHEGPGACFRIVVGENAQRMAA
jgi:two-component system, NtrC family, sensor histidine kinase HydH